MPSYEAHKNYIAWAKTMATQRNGDAKLESTDVMASDPLITRSFLLPGPTESTRHDNSSYVPKYDMTEYNVGTLNEHYHVQTGRLLYQALGSCSETDNDPIFTHDISPRSSLTPVYAGRHDEREHSTDAESERIDLLGLMPKYFAMECTEKTPKMRQNLVSDFLFHKSTGTDDIAEPTKLTDKFYEWTHRSIPTFTFDTGSGSETMEATVMGWRFEVANPTAWYGLDTSGYFTVGECNPFTYINTYLMIIPTGKNAFELLRTARSSMTTNVAFTIKFTRSTNDYIQIADTDAYMHPFEIVPGHRFGWREGYRITLHHAGSGSLAVQVKDAYDETYYTNP